MFSTPVERPAASGLLACWPPAGGRVAGLLAASLALNAYLLLGNEPMALASASASAITCESPRLCTCEGKPLGPDVKGDVNMFYYPWFNYSLASVFDTRAYLGGEVVPLSQFRAKAVMVANTASN
uniref:Uncharacterized protein n=1 Tax=Prymnesium polylepis TaxID=72548 RepID=A0A7S4I832_9EUKA|mmetsp:Transcript_27917/g.68976  ORF Transcript_27917/g.68976 Transcript_27917/m.68976 type:complete len:125 (+) Transcript_27917:3-377(+)